MIEQGADSQLAVIRDRNRHRARIHVALHHHVAPPAPHLNEAMSFENPADLESR